LVRGAGCRSDGTPRACPRGENIILTMLYRWDMNGKIRRIADFIEFCLGVRTSSNGLELIYGSEGLTSQRDLLIIR
jgi:hypothetical protein